MGRQATYGSSRLKEPLRLALSDVTSILFLCSGNMVRSAYAELYARHRGCPVPVQSAATHYRNTGLYPETRAALTGLGIGRLALDSFRSRHLDELGQEIEPSAVVLGMTKDHLRAFWKHRRTSVELRGRIFLLGDLMWVSEEIPDPVEDGAPFGQTFDRVAKAVDILMAELRALRDPAGHS